MSPDTKIIGRFPTDNTIRFPGFCLPLLYKADISYSEQNEIFRVKMSHSQSLEVEGSMNIDTNLAKCAVFSLSNICGGTFNVTLHIKLPMQTCLE